MRILESKSIRRVGGTTEYPVSFRPVFAVQPGIEKLVDEKKFLLDLYHRVRVLKIQLPALRDRREDIAPLVAHFTALYNKEYSTKKVFQVTVVKLFENCQWPGNIRELRNTVRQSLIDSTEDSVGVKHLDSAFGNFQEPEMPASTLAEFDIKQEREKKLFVASMIRRSRTVQDAARQMNIAGSTLHSMIERMKIGSKKNRNTSL